MATPTFELISAVTVGSGGASTISFSSIPATYTDLCLKLSARTARADASDVVAINFNGSSSGITMKYLQGTGSSASSSSSSTYIWTRVSAANNTSNTFGNAEIYIPNYAGGSYKSVSTDGVSENNATEAYTNLVAGLWSSTAAITSIALTSANGESFVQYSTAYLYGISNS